MPSFLNKFSCTSARSFSPPPDTQQDTKPRRLRSLSLRRKKSNKPTYISNTGSSNNIMRPSAPPLAVDIANDVSNRSSFNQHYPNLNYTDNNNNASDSNLQHTANASYETNENFSFWDIGNYKYALKRCDNGHKLGSELIDMISERAKLEENYAKSIRQWNKKWSQHLNNESSEYETTKLAWKAFLDAGIQTSDIHLDMCKALINKPVFKIQQWLKKKYEKSFLSFKQTKEFEADFVTNAKPWVEQIDKLKKLKREYYDSIRATKQAEDQATAAQSSPKHSQEQKDKLEEKAKRSREEQDRTLKRYKDQLVQIDLYKPRHMEKMIDVFNKTQNFEHDRIMFFKQTFSDCYDIMQIHQDERLDTIFSNYIKQVNNVNPKHDLEYWSHKYGPDTRPNWPVFEEYQGN